MLGDSLILKKINKVLLGLYKNITPFLDWISELKNTKTVKADVIAGTTVALVLVPQSMAYAQLAGLPPYYGLYASCLPVAIAAFFGSSRQLATGPVAVVSLLTASAIEPLAVSGGEGYFIYAVMLAFMVGMVQLILGIVRLGMMVDFLSHPVVTGFTNAAAIIIATSQLNNIFGVEVDRAEYHYQVVWETLKAGWENPHLFTLLIAIGSLALMVVLRKYLPRSPNVLIAVIVATLVSWFFDFEANGGRVVGNIPEGLPSFELPTISWAMIQQMTGVALAIALIGFMEAISIAKAMAVKTRQRLDADQELIGQGLSNITSSLFQGYAVSGSFSRSAVNIESGAITGFSSIVTAILIGITLLFLTPLLYHLPQATLAAVIILAVASLVRIKSFKNIWRIQYQDGFVAIVTFVLTLLFAPHLETGILIGVVLSLGLYVYRTMRPDISLLGRHADGGLKDAAKYILKVCPQIAIVRFGGPLFFANTGYFHDKVLERVSNQPELRFIIIDAVSMNEIDATGQEMLYELARTLVEQDIEFLFARPPIEVMNTFERSGFASEEWADSFFNSRDQALQYAWERLAKQKNTCPAEGCEARDMSGCILRKDRRKPNRLLRTMWGAVPKQSTASD